jgi:hypothetical protein
MNANVKPRFEVHKIEGTAKRRIACPKYILDDKGKPKLDKNDDKMLAGGFTYEDIDHDAGWMVYFPNGSSIRIWTKSEMERQGFLDEPGLIDMDTGDTVRPVQAESLKARSEQKERVTKSSKVHHVT